MLPGSRAQSATIRQLLLGTAILANVVMGYASQSWGWSSTFILLLAACVICIALMALTYKAEQKKLAS